MIKKIRIFTIFLLVMSCLFSLTSAEAFDGLDSGLVAYWSFNNQDNPGYDDTGNGYNGTVYGATWTGEGITGGAMNFDGVDDYISIPIYDYFSISYTASVWFKSTSGTLDMLVDQESFPKAPIHIGVSEKNVWVTIRDSESKGISVSTADSFNDGEWHHVVAVRTGADNGSVTIELYVDGVYYGADTGILKDTASNENPLEIGRRSDNEEDSREFEGTIDEVRIYNRPVTDEEVLKLYDNELLIQPSYFDLDVNNLIISKQKHDKKLIFTTSGKGESPDFSGLKNRDVIQAKVTIELLGSAPDGGNIVMSDEEIYLEVKKSGKNFTIIKTNRPNKKAMKKIGFKKPIRWW